METTGNKVSDLHEAMVRYLIKSPTEIAAFINPRDADLIHSVLGISGEAGELLDAVKKHVIYKKPLDLENIIEELGDLEFYLCNIRRVLKLNRDAIIQANIDKLSKRYPDGYTDAAAIARADKQGDK